MRVRPYVIAMVTAVLGTLVPGAAAFAASSSGGASAGGATAKSAQTGAAPATPATTPAPPATTAPTPAGAATGGQEFGTQNPATTPTVDGLVAQILPDGMAAAPTLAPPAVQQAIWAGNQIVGLPYVYGGGHSSFRAKSKGYDCSGTVSYALHGGGLLNNPLDSSSFMTWGASGAGTWITVFTNPGHAYMTVAGIRLDTSAADDPSGAKGPRWRPLRDSDGGYHRRHPVGL